MNKIIKEAITSNKTLKLVSLILAFSTWSLLSNYQSATSWVEVPVCFYNTPSDMKVAANQEALKVQIRGKLTDLAHCQNLALHIDATDFKPGQQRINPCAEQLFLPNSVTLVHNKPLYLEITTTVA